MFRVSAMSGAAGRCRDLVRSNFFRVVASDVCALIAVILVLISVAVGTGHPTDNFSWSHSSLQRTLAYMQR